MLTQTQQVDLTLHHLKERTLSIYTPEQRASIEISEDWKQFDRRLEEHFPKLMHELDNVYNNNEGRPPHAGATDCPSIAKLFTTQLILKRY